MKYLLILLFLFSSSVYVQEINCNSSDCKEYMNLRYEKSRDNAKNFELKRKELKETRFREECYNNNVFNNEDEWCVTYKKIKDDKARILNEQEIAETTEEDLIEEDTQDLQSNIETAKSICKEIGFKIGTEKFGECVLKLYSKDKLIDETIRAKSSREREQEEANRKYNLEQQNQLDTAKLFENNNASNKCVTSSDLDWAVNDIKQHIESWSTSPKRLKLRK